MRGARGILASLVIAVAAGGLTFTLWRILGMPDGGVPLDAPFPGLWRWFFAVCLPLLFPAFTSIHVWLARVAPPGAAPAVAAAIRWDRWSHVALAVFPGWLLAWRGAASWRLALGGFFVTVLLAKTLLLVVALYRAAFGRAEPEDDAEALPHAAVFLGAAALLLYAGLVPYVVTAVSSTGDEPLYLISTHSLLVDRDFGLENNTRQGDFRSFYWGRGRPWDGQGGFLALPVLLLPGYGMARALLPAYPLAGRLGATLIIALCAALAGVVAYRLCRDLDCPRPAAFWAWVTLALAPPFVVASGHLYPEVPAVLLTLLGVRAILRMPGQPQAGAVVLGAAVALVLLKERFLSLALGLPVWAGLRVTRRSRWAPLGWLVGLGLVAAAVVLAARTPGLFPYLADLRFRHLLAWNRQMPVAALGMAADQEFGLLFYAPAWILAVIGIPGLWRRHREATLGLLWLFGGYALVVIKYRWMQWDAGWTPPPRFILAAVPLLVPFLAEGFQRLRGPGLAAVHTLWLVWGAAVTWCLALVPFWRYNGLTGRSTLLRLAGAALGLDFARFLPSLRDPTAWTWAVLGAGGLVLAVVTVCAARRPAATPRPDVGWGVGALLLRPGPAVGLVVGVALTWLVAAVAVPTWSIEAEAMSHTAGIQFGSYQWDDVLWVMQRDGEISERIVTWPGRTRITVVAGGLSTTGVAPRMTLLLDDEVVGEWELEFGHVRSWWERTFAMQGWLGRKYVAVARTRFGRPTLRLRIAQTLDQRDTGRVQQAYVDRVMLEWAPSRDRPE